MVLNYSILSETKKELLKNKKELRHFNQQAITEIQIILKHNNYYKGKVDGLYGPKTLKAFSKFKQDRYLAYPTWVGMSTLKALALIAPKSQVKFTPESVSLAKDVKINLYAGTKTGRQMRLPTGETVYENQYVVPGIPLTWGEVSKRCTRVPHNRQVVRNLKIVAKGFAGIRTAFGSALYITSGYRPPYLKIGAKYSQHKLGLALDIYPVNRNLNRLWDVILRSSAVGIGDGRRKGFIHVDWRISGNRVIFNY